MTSGAAEPRPPLWRWQYVMAAIGTAAGVIGTFAVLADDDAGPVAPAPVVSAPEAPATAPTTRPTPTTPGVPDSAQVRLGADLRADNTEHCRPPGTATGSAWQLGAVRIDNRAVGQSYHCHLFAGAVGSLDFVLGKSYRELRVTIGFSDDSGALDHTARFEVIAEGDAYVTEPRVLRVGQAADLVVDVRGRSRLRLRVVEQQAPGGSGGFSKPVWADAVLVR